MLHNNSRKRKEESKICKLNYFHLSAILIKIKIKIIKKYKKKNEKIFSQKFRILFKKTQMNPPRESPFHPLHNRTIVQPISVITTKASKIFLYCVGFSRYTGTSTTIKRFKEFKLFLKPKFS